MKLHLNDLYWTVQGEGYHSGRHALFVRFPFCSLKCSWCDTSFNTYREWELKDFENFSKSFPSRFAVLTGGEPSIHRHTPLVMERLLKLGFKDFAMESNGCHPIPEGVNFLTVSPKKDSQRLSQNEAFYIHPDAYKKAFEFKYVVDKDFDFKVLSRHDVTDGRKYFLSPEYGEMKENLKKIMTFIEKHPQWKISLQTHKWMGVK